MNMCNSLLTSSATAELSVEPFVLLDSAQTILLYTDFDHFYFRVFFNRPV